MVPAYLVSLLTRQVQMLQREEFLKRHPHPWLVWEPGNWDPPRTPTESDIGKTHLPDPSRPAGPGAGDALCFELVAKDSEHLFRVGRSSDCEIVLNDMTVSREQFHLAIKDSVWTLVPLQSARTSLEARDVTGPVKLERAASLQAGGLKLSFVPAPAFVDRLLAR